MNANEVSELMNLRGWSQAELARQLEVSEATISRWVAGKQVPNKPTRRLIHEWLEEARKQPA